MKIHPTPKKRDLNSVDGDASSATATPYPKKLKRLPHVFAKVLELPFNSDADVFVQETPESFRFVANNGDITVTHDFRTHVIEILPGVTKIEVRVPNSTTGYDSSLEDLDIDTWRFRLPATTRPQMASAKCIGGQLVVTIPKAVNLENTIHDDDDNIGKEVLE